MRNYIQKIKDYCLKNGIKLEFSSNNEFYFVSSEKRIHFGNEEEKYNSFDLYRSFHELCHSTSLFTKRNTDNYAKEEVIADLSAGQIMLKLGMYNLNNNPILANNQRKEIYALIWKHISYSGSWATAFLRDNPTFTFEDLKNEVNDEILKVVELLKKELEV